MSLQPKQFQQLQMLMKPSEVQAMPGFEFGDQFHTGDPEVDVDMLRQQKLREAGSPVWQGPDHPAGESLARQLRNEGIRTPLDVSHRNGRGATLNDGHHRFFVAERWENQGQEVYLPVKHRQSPWDA